MTEQTATTTEPTEDSLKDLRAAAARAKDLERENEALRRDRAFRQAGLNPDDKRTGYFIKGYDGDLEPDAIRREATEAGFLAEPGPDPQQQQQLEGTDRIGQIVQDKQPVGSQDAEAALQQAFQEGGVAGLAAAAQQLGIPLVDD